MFDKITSRVSKLCYELNPDFVDPVSCYNLIMHTVTNFNIKRLAALTSIGWWGKIVGGFIVVFLPDQFFKHIHLFFQAQVTMKVINGLYPGVTTVELDNLAAEICATNATKHPDFAILAARIAVSNLHKETKKVFSGEILLL